MHFNFCFLTCGASHSVCIVQTVSSSGHPGMWGSASAVKAKRPAYHRLLNWQVSVVRYNARLRMNTTKLLATNHHTSSTAHSSLLLGTRASATAKSHLAGERRRAKLRSHLLLPAVRHAEKFLKMNWSKTAVPTTNHHVRSVDGAIGENAVKRADGAKRRAQGNGLSWPVNVHLLSGNALQRTLRA